MKTDDKNIKEKGSYFAIIPASVRYDANLSSLAKLFYAEITSLSNAKGFCWANNEYFMNCFEISERTCNRVINQLKNCGYINIDYIYKKDSKQIEKRVIVISDKLPSISDKTVALDDNIGGDKNDSTGGDIFDHIGGDKNGGDNNKSIYNNNTSLLECEKVVELYHSILPMLPKIKKLNKGRCNKIVVRLGEMDDGIRTMQDVFEKIALSSFLTGKNERKWCADLDWVIKNDSNWVKIIEGKYDNGSNHLQEGMLKFNIPQQNKPKGAMI